MFCTKCAALIVDNAPVCASCGHNINGDDSNTNSNTSPTQVNGIILDSPAPLQDKISKFNYFYWIAIILGIIFGLFSGGVAIPIFVGFFCLIIYAIRHFICSALVVKLNKMKFNLPRDIKDFDLAGLITISLTQLNMKVEMLPCDEIRVTHNKVEHHIFIDHPAMTFAMHSSQSAAAIFFTGIRWIPVYKRSILSNPIIAYTIQDQLNQKA